MAGTVRKIVIIGGGIAGLCAGVYARRCGYEVDLVEMHERPGGLATSWQRDGYTFETCLHWRLGSNPERRMHAHWREVFDIDCLRFLQPAEYVRFETESGDCLVVYSDPDRLEAELLRVSQEDAHESRRFVAAVREFPDVEIPEPPESRKDWLGLIAALPRVPAVHHWAHISLRDQVQLETPHLVGRRCIGRTLQPGGEPLAALNVAALSVQVELRAAMSSIMR